MYFIEVCFMWALNAMCVCVRLVIFEFFDLFYCVCVFCLTFLCCILFGLFSVYMYVWKVTNNRQI